MTIDNLIEALRNHSPTSFEWETADGTDWIFTGCLEGGGPALAVLNDAGKLIAAGNSSSASPAERFVMEVFRLVPECVHTTENASILCTKTNGDIASVSGTRRVIKDARMASIIALRRIQASKASKPRKGGRRKSSGPKALSPRQKEAYELSAQGFNVTAIAAQMGVGVPAASTYLAEARKRVDAMEKSCQRASIASVRARTRYDV